MKTPETLLLHICCAPCGGGCVSALQKERRAARLYFSNSNLADRAEFDRRLESVKKLAALCKMELEVDPYDHGSWLEAVRGLESEPEHGRRCDRCFRFSLLRTAARAAETGEKFATTLTVSPHKNSAQIFAAAENMSAFEAIDFKKNGTYAESCRIARENGFYRQNFCGCEFSRRNGALKK
ncbi:MAG: epoxyqueuosine reductase QueH [Victivallaceae bacterium]|nr:epoxyqueuosine reductase QueH [Victivallaceae bacterium]